MLKGTPPPEDPEDNWEEVQAPADLQQDLKQWLSEKRISTYDKTWALGENKLSHDDVQKICRILHDHPGSVSELLLNSNGLEDKSAEAIAELLKTNNTVKLLWIPSNKEKGILALSQMLKFNKGLTQLSMWGHPMDLKAAAALAESLKENTTIQILNIPNMKIPLQGAKLIAEALHSNTTLKRLFIANNKLGVESVPVFCELIRKNNTLEQLDLSSNKLDSDDAIQQIAEAMRSNSSITDLYLRSTKFGLETCKILRDLMEQRPKLRVYFFNMEETIQLGEQRKKAAEDAAQAEEKRIAELIAEKRKLDKDRTCVYIAGSTGNIGTSLVQLLVAEDQWSIRCATRHKDKANELNNLSERVTGVHVNYYEKEQLPEGMLGCTKLVLIPPFWPTMPLFCKVFVDAATQVGVKQIIMVSIMDTSVTPTPLYKQWFSEAEKYVQESGIDYTVIRSAFPYSNLLYHSENIKANSKIVQNTDPEVKLAALSLSDIAQVIKAVLQTAEYSNKIVDISGDKLLTMAEITRIISKHLGKEVQYVKSNFDETRKELVTVKKVHPVVAKALVEYWDQVDQTSLLARNAFNEITKKNPTPFDEWLLSSLSHFQ